MPQDWLRLEALPLPLLRIQGLMLRLLRRLMRRKAPGVLVAMRLEDMHVVHPMQDNTRSCVRCRHVVGIYPSGQAALKRWPRLEIQCARCAQFDVGIPAARSREEFLAEKRNLKPRC